MSLKKTVETSIVHFMVKFIYDLRFNDGRLSCHIICSRDLFNEHTTETIARRFQQLFVQLFSLSSSPRQIDVYEIPINKLTLILPEEIAEMQGILFCRQANMINEGMRCNIYNV